MSTTNQPQPHRLAFGASFFVFGLINNVLYVVILSAALDLLTSVGSTLPKGVILATSIAPGLVVKVTAPYIRGSINYRGRIVFCSLLSFVGICTVASSSSLGPRLGGIALASFSSGLGEMSYLQLSTVYGTLPVAHDLGGIAVGWFASGTGAAGLVGAGLWWILRGLGVRTGLLICSILPLGMSAVYFLLLPQPAAFATVRLDAYDFITDSDDDNSDDGTQHQHTTPLASSSRTSSTSETVSVHLSLRDKLVLLRPLLIPFCLPLFSVYFAEYTINQGVSPGLIYAVPDRATSPVLSLLIKSLRDYYPLYQLVYQTFVFISRSSLSLFHLPPLPMSLLPVPSLVQLGLLAITSLESATGFISSSLGDGATTWIVLGLISVEGLCGGSAYVNAYYHLGQQMDDEDDHLGGTAKDSVRVAQEREFRIASVGVFDTLGILMAAGAASFLEPRLCRAQQDRGKALCIGL